MDRSAREVVADMLKETYRSSFPRSLCLKRADAILAALRDADFVVAPVEPTEAMLIAGINAAEGVAVTDRQKASVYGEPREFYRAMIAAHDKPDDS
jgi:hypothetical protein